MIDAIIARAVAAFAGHGLKFAAVAAAIAMVGTWDWRRINRAEERGRQEVRVEAERKSNDNARKADAARADADRLPAGRVFDWRCRDCDRR